VSVAPSDSPPAFRRFLAGGPEALRLSPRAAVLVAVVGLVLIVSGGLLSTYAVAAPKWQTLAAAIPAALLTAVLAARWLGSRFGAAAGMAQLTTLGVLQPGGCGPQPMLACAAFSAAAGAFSLANVPGRMPTVDGRRMGRAFYAAAVLTLFLAGPGAVAFLFAGCLAFSIISVDPRCVRFLANPLGIGLVVPLIVWQIVWPAAPAPGGDAVAAVRSLPEVLGGLAVAGMPWTVPCVWAAIAGLRQGHYATPVWRFFACWLVGPLVLVAAGTPCDSARLVLLLPPLAVTGAAGLLAAAAWIRRRAGRWIRAKSG